jgi:quinol monooxygenase YgiN
MLWQLSRLANVLRPASVLHLAHVMAVSVVALAAMGSLARAQEPFAYVVGYIETMPSAEKQAAEFVSRYAASGRDATGNLRFQALQRIDRPNQFAFVMAWKDQKDAEAYAASATTQQFHDKLAPLLSAPYDERPYTGLDVGSTEAVGSIPPAPGAKDMIYAVTHVDIVPTKKDDGIAALKDISAPSRTESGNLRYEVLQQNSRANHFTLVEVWRDQKALEAHEVAAHTVKMRQVLLPIEGALYDQRLYHALD